MTIKIRRVHFVGLGGIGMSGIAEVLINRGFSVSGSDLKNSAVLDRLRKLGARVAIGHAAEHVGDADVLVYSSAVDKANPELLEAKGRGVPIIPRAEMLAELMRMKEGVAVAGSHGKTTTTSLVAWILSEAGFDPTCIIGGRLEQFDSNARLGEGSLLVAEADESDGSFLKLTPVMTVITNIDPEHLDHYGTFDNLEAAFVAFANSVPFYGMNVMCLDHPVVRAILPRVARRYATYGFGEDADFTAKDARGDGMAMRFSVWKGSARLGEVRLPMPGLHNVLNALAAIVCAMELEIPFQTIIDALATFQGPDRRFQVKGAARGVTVIDDYGHHPEEIRATLAAARTVAKGKIWALFQPHRFTRVRDLFRDFSRSFSDADVLLVTDIYPASERPIPGITSEALYEAIRKTGHPDARYVADMNDAARAAAAEMQDGDMLITLGAGDVKNAGVLALKRLRGEEA
ncbi:MAG: UDP-N-acetylmuramate--L-alanine ligase [Myxococcales bacterium]|nr:MAG: UDP-N-acetylmuramate--L-alanine ligase [Myxococcales bacterium]